MSSREAICNQAISWLGGNIITTIDDESDEAILCKANYSELRDAVLEEGKWTFATSRFRLVPNPAAPVSKYAYKFELPTSVLIVDKVSNTQQYSDDWPSIDYRREEDFIVCDYSVIYIKAIIKIEDMSKWTASAKQALAARIAADIAVPLTGSAKREYAMQEKYDKLVDKALAIDGMQGSSERIRSSSRIVRVR